MTRRRWVPLAVAVALGVTAPVTAQALRGVPTVLFAPAMQAALKTSYGPLEGPVLERTIREGVDAALRGAGCETVAQVEITLLDARPTHPTDRQIDDDPALDRLLTRYDGGAAFSVRLLDATGRALKSLRYDWYALDRHQGSRTAEPWGDVRLASEGLGAELARTCRALARPHPTTP